MRWLYIPDEDDPDFIAKQETIARIETWWQDFEKIVVPLWNSKISHVDDPSCIEFTEWVAENINKIHPNIMWESHRKPDETIDFVCTVEDNYNDGALVQTMVSKAPQLKNWRFLTHRTAVEFDSLQIYLQETAGLKIPSDIRVSWVKSKINRIILGYHSSLFTDDLVEDLTLLLKLTSALLGEEMFEKWIDRVEPVKPASTPVRMFNQLIGRTNPVTFNINVLQEQCTKMTNQILSSLPDKFFSNRILPHERDDTQVFLWNRQPDEDNVPARRRDRLTYNFVVKSLLNAIVSGMYFHSHCHSKLGEVFCYIEMTELESYSKNSLDDRELLAIFIDNRLRKEELGCVFGTGMGFDSCYVDLALRDVEKAIPVLREIATEKNLPEASWLFFYDSNLQDEWVGLHKSTKAPPVVEEEPLDFKPG